MSRCRLLLPHINVIFFVYDIRYLIVDIIITGKHVILNEIDLKKRSWEPHVVKKILLISFALQEKNLISSVGWPVFSAPRCSCSNQMSDFVRYVLIAGNRRVSSLLKYRVRSGNVRHEAWH